MSLSKKQKDFLKTIENPKDRKYQKQQFKLQNKFDRLVVFEFNEGLIQTSNPKLIAFFSQHSTNKTLENSLTKETLRDLTEPKTDNRDIPKEFCVKITEENKKVLDKIWRDFHKGNVLTGLYPNNYLHSNSLFMYCVKSNDYTLDDVKKEDVVSTEEFLRYIGKEELIEKTDSAKTTDEPKPLNFDLPKKEDFNVKEYLCFDLEELFYRVNSGEITIMNLYNILREQKLN